MTDDKIEQKVRRRHYYIRKKVGCDKSLNLDQWFLN